MDTNDKQPLDKRPPRQEPSSAGATPPVEKIGVTLEDWLQKMCSNMERMTNDEEYRRRISESLF